MAIASLNTVQLPSSPIDFKAIFISRQCPFIILRGCLIKLSVLWWTTETSRGWKSRCFNRTDPSLSPRGCVRIKTAAPLLPLLALLLIFLLLLETTLVPLDSSVDLVSARKTPGVGLFYWAVTRSLN